jgi:5-formyltetrahydrofolate cyclo-ligase
MNIPDEKAALRKAMVGRILAVDPALRGRQSAELAWRLTTLPGFAEAGTVLLYVSAFPEEIETRLEDLAADLAPGTLGILEPGRSRPEVPPDQIDWALVPGLAFDEQGFRLGRGAGHYDRLLPRLRPDAPRWALAFDVQWVDRLPREPHDQPLDGIVSPNRTLRRAR